MIREHLKPVEVYDPEQHGLLNPYFRYADGLPASVVRRDNDEFVPLREAERHRLVEAAKSPTNETLSETARRNAFHALTLLRAYEEPPLVHQASGPFSDLRDRKSCEQLAELTRTVPTNANGSQTIIEYREWAGEYRVRTQVSTPFLTPPPPCSGSRTSTMLSERGALKIAESCMYMAEKKGGYRTFVTGTFDSEARARIERGESTIQKEVTRTMDALQQLYRRGWTTPSGERIGGHGEALPYCWVVEVPKNRQGEPNPHVHMMLGWSVEYQHFDAWAARIESIWGNGYFHLEKINDPLCAGAYMAKSAGYMTKAAGKTDQGTVKGNRYSISSTARAPGWETVGAWALDVMGCIIWDLHHKLQRKHGFLFAERKRLNQERERIRESSKRKADPIGKRIPPPAQRRLKAIEMRLSVVRQRINQLPIRSNKYQLRIKQKAMPLFINYAKSQGWFFGKRPDSLWLAEFKRRRQLRQKLRDAWQSTEELAEHVQAAAELRDKALRQWEEYESMKLRQ